MYFIYLNIFIFIIGILIRKISPKFGKMTADIAKQKGYLRFLYLRIQVSIEFSLQ
jgi:hypothetical protein